MGIFNKSKNRENPDDGAAEEAARVEAEIDMPEPNYEKLVTETKESGKELRKLQNKLAKAQPGTADHKELMKQLKPAETKVALFYVRVQLADLANDIALRNEDDPDMPNLPARFAKLEVA